jgi:carboxypeptidase C (cathepsin A)
MRQFRYLLLLGAATLVTSPSAYAQTTPKEPAPAEKSAKPKAEDADEAQASTVENAQPKRGSVTTSSGKRIDYTVTPGTLIIRDTDGAPIASVFYVSYVADAPKGSAPRPVTFTFNGGPGSSSMWLHLGSIGPVHVDTETAQTGKPAPYVIRENPKTMLDKTDIVFIDAIGTGLSRPVGKGKGADFWGVDQDIDAYAKAIQRYLAINDRWDSPKFLFGESYGTLRAAGLAYTLQSQGVQLNGVVLLSSILNYGIRQPGYDQSFVTFLPSYAATAWYHNKVANRPAAITPFIAEVREWARGPYQAALAKGDDLPEADRQAIAQQMSAYTGLSTKFILDADLRVDLSRFRKELLRDNRQTVGRLDSRFTGWDVDAAGEQPEYDASDTAISGPYIGAINKYLFGTLGYKTKLSYRPNFYSGIAGSWDQKHRVGNRNMALAVTSIDLGKAMRENPHLKVISLNGYYDMATPFFGAEYDLKHMQLDPSLRKNLTFAYYESGHMVYIRPEAMAQMKIDLDGFYASAVTP